MSRCGNATRSQFSISSAAALDRSQNNSSECGSKSKMGVPSHSIFQRSAPRSNWRRGLSREGYWALRRFTAQPTSRLASARERPNSEDSSCSTSLTEFPSKSAAQMRAPVAFNSKKFPVWRSRQSDDAPRLVKANRLEKASPSASVTNLAFGTGSISATKVSDVRLLRASWMVRRNIKRCAGLRQQLAQIPKALNARWLILSPGPCPFCRGGRERQFIRGSLAHRSQLFPSVVSVHVALSTHSGHFPA